MRCRRANVLISSLIDVAELQSVPSPLPGPFWLCEWTEPKNDVSADDTIFDMLISQPARARRLAA